MNSEPAHSISKRGRVGEGRPTLYTRDLANRLADHIAAGLTDEEAAALEDISCDCIQRWHKGNPEFCVTIKRAEAERLEGLPGSSAANPAGRGPHGFWNAAIPNVL